MRKITWISVGSAIALALVIGGALALWHPSTALADTAAPAVEASLASMASATDPNLPALDIWAHGRGPGGGLRGIDHAQYLADALGITVEELEAAYEQARVAAIDLAVEKGLITQEQADEMTVWGGGRGWRGAKPGAPGSEIDGEALLADALGITVAELDAARVTAAKAAIAQAVEDGTMTQEQADEMLSRMALHDYVDRDALLATALGMTVEELRAATADGQTLSDLLADQGMDAQTARTKLEAAYEAAIAQAVKDGVITQEQADEILSRPGIGLGGFGGAPCGPGMRGGSGMRGGPRGFDSDGGMRGGPRMNPSDDSTSGVRINRGAGRTNAL